MKHTTLTRSMAIAFTAGAILCDPVVLHAQIPLPVPAQPAPATAEPGLTTAEAEASLTDPDSPRASLRAFLDAAGSGRWQEATRYLSLTAAQHGRGARLAEHLKSVIDSRRLIDLETVSGESSGHLDDGLPANLEQVAALRVDDREEPVRLRRASDAEGKFWSFSPATVASVDEWYMALPDRWLRDALWGTRFNALLRPGFFGVLWLHWILLPPIALLAWAAGRLLQGIARRFVTAVASRTTTIWDDRLAESFGPPFGLATSVILFALGCGLIQLTPGAIGVVGTFTRPILAFAVFWGLWRAVPVLLAFLTSREWAVNSASARHLLSIGSNLLRSLVFGLGVLATIAAFGYPIGTVLAGVGIGGLALAFGAQKTVENLFGSVSLAADQPFRIGDFVKVEDFVGTVEDVGLRSTRFRTLDRTLVSIPNGKLAEQRLESYEVRDRMRLAATVGLTYGTTQSQMRTVLAGLKRVLQTHPRIWPDAVVVKFKEFGPSSLDIEIMAWFQVPTWGDFQDCREQVLLDFMGVVEEAGASFAFPTRTVHLVQSGTGEDRASET